MQRLSNLNVKKALKGRCNKRIRTFSTSYILWVLLMEHFNAPFNWKYKKTVKKLVTFFSYKNYLKIFHKPLREHHLTFHIYYYYSRKEKTVLVYSISYRS